MNVLTPVKITVALMPTAQILLEVITALAMLDTLEMATHVMVNVFETPCIENKMYFGKQGTRHNIGYIYLATVAYSGMVILSLIGTPCTCIWVKVYILMVFFTSEYYRHDIAYTYVKGHVYSNARLK